MSNVSVMRGVVLAVAITGVLLLSAAAVWACVPQRGTLEVVSEENATEVNSAVEDVIVGDGNSNTDHWESWCEDHGGHPVDAVEAGLQDQITVTINDSTADQVNGECPDPDDPDESTSSLPSGTTFIYMNDGNAYIWQDGDDASSTNYQYDGFWNFDPDQVAKDTPGCYKDGQDPVEQDTFQYDGSGQKSHTFTLTEGNQDWNTNTPGENASVLCVGTEAGIADEVGIFAPVVVTSV